MLEVQWTERTGGLRSATGLLEDISAVGACLQMECEIPVEIAVDLRYDGVKIPAEVKYCVFQEIGYYVGIVFRDGFRWSSRSFQPQHMLDVRRLM